MWVDEFFLIATLLVVWFVWNRNNAVVTTCSILLLAWYLLASFTYIKGEIETQATILTALIYVVMCAATICFYPHWLPIYLLLSGILMVVWSLVYTGPDAYTYKAVKNAVYLGELLSVFGCSVWDFWKNNNTRDDR